jgi:hypothetical protein
MPSSEYKTASNEFREQAITNYLRLNPGVRRDQIVIRYVNGQVVCEDITLSFDNNPTGLPSFDAEQLGQLGKLENGGDKKYASSIQSLQACKQYVERMFKTNTFPFNKIDYDDHNDNILRKQYQTASCALDLSDFRKKLDWQKKDNADPSESVIRILMMEYFETSTSQLRCIESVYLKEAGLLNQYITFSEVFIKDTYVKLKDRLDEKSVNAIKKALSILKKSHLIIPKFPAKDDIIDKQELKIYAERLHEFELKLIPRRTQLKPVFKLVTFLEATLKELEEINSTHKATRMSLRRTSSRK